MNAILAGCGFNLRKLLRAFVLRLFKELERLGWLIWPSQFGSEASNATI
jgi:outer membrane lipopolysaccharide assembly protein LptE/RlpB